MNRNTNRKRAGMLPILSSHPRRSPREERIEYGRPTGLPRHSGDQVGAQVPSPDCLTLRLASNRIPTFRWDIYSAVTFVTEAMRPPADNRVWHPMAAVLPTHRSLISEHAGNFFLGCCS